MKPSTPLLIKAALVLFILLNLFLVLKLRGTTNVSQNEGKGAEMKAEILLKNIYVQMESEGAVMFGHLLPESEPGVIFVSLNRLPDKHYSPSATPLPSPCPPCFNRFISRPLRYGTQEEKTEERWSQRTT